MFFLYLFVTCWIESSGEIHLQVADQDASLLRFQRVTLAEDGSYLGIGAYTVWHWDAQGQVVRHFGGKGEGPGEFIAISDALWDGSHYWVIDGGRQMSSVFDDQGRFLFKKPLYYRQLIRSGENLFVLEMAGVRLDIPHFPPVIQPIRYHISQNDLQIDRDGPAFRKITPTQRAFRLNFKLVWVVAEDSRYLVVDQLEPKMAVFTQHNRELEQLTASGEPYSAPSIPLNLVQWVDPPGSLPTDQMSPQQMRKWWYSFSRINFFGEVCRNQYYAIAYESPDPDDPQASVQRIQLVDVAGKNVVPAFETDGSVVGIAQQAVVLYQAEELEGTTLHKVVFFNLN